MLAYVPHARHPCRGGWPAGRGQHPRLGCGGQRARLRRPARPVTAFENRRRPARCRLSAMPDTCWLRRLGRVVAHGRSSETPECRCCEGSLHHHRVRRTNARAVRRRPAKRRLPRRIPACGTGPRAADRHRAAPGRHLSLASSSRRCNRRINRQRRPAPDRPVGTTRARGIAGTVWQRRRAPSSSSRRRDAHRRRRRRCIPSSSRRWAACRCGSG